MCSVIYLTCLITLSKFGQFWGSKTFLILHDQLIATE